MLNRHLGCSINNLFLGKKKEEEKKGKTALFLMRDAGLQIDIVSPRLQYLAVGVGVSVS